MLQHLPGIFWILSRRDRLPRREVDLHARDSGRAVCARRLGLPYLSRATDRQRYLPDQFGARRRWGGSDDPLAPHRRRERGAVEEAGAAIRCRGWSGDPMKAIQFTRYGSPDVLELTEVEKPVPKDDEALIKVYAASVNALDRHRLHEAPAVIHLIAGGGARKPKDPRIGVDLAGWVEAVGSAVTLFHRGDDVFGIGTGALAEYACAHEDNLAIKPASMSFEAAAAVPIAALTAL